MQTLYGMADLYIVGQFNDTAQITAVSVGSQVMHMLTVMIVGLAMGTTVSIARAVGAGEGRRTSAIVGSTITLFMVVALAAMALLLVCKPHCDADVHTGGRCGRDPAISDHLLCRDSLYHGL